MAALQRCWAGATLPGVHLALGARAVVGLPHALTQPLSAPPLQWCPSESPCPLGRGAQLRPTEQGLGWGRASGSVRGGAGETRTWGRWKVGRAWVLGGREGVHEGRKPSGALSAKAVTPGFCGPSMWQVGLLLSCDGPKAVRALTPRWGS